MSESENPWGFDDASMQYYGTLTKEHQEYLPWFFTLYKHSAIEKAESIKGNIDILNNPQSVAHKEWVKNFDWYMKHESARNFISMDMHIGDLAHLIFPFSTHEREHSVFIGMLIRLIGDGFLNISSYPWQGKLSFIVNHQVGEERIRALSDERSRIHLYLELDEKTQTIAKININNFLKVSSSDFHLSKCAAIWASYISYVMKHGAYPSGLLFAPSPGISDFGLSGVISEAIRPDFETFHRGNTEPARKTREKSKQSTQAQIDKWKKELEDLWKTEKYSKHIAACRDIADKHIRETGDIITPEHIADETRETYWKLNPKKVKKPAK